MLHEEVKKYRELSGDTNPNTPISRIGGYLDGYEKALEQEPCEDAISRQAVLDMMQMRMSGKELYKAVYELPSVNPQEPPKHTKCDRCPYGETKVVNICNYDGDGCGWD